MTERGNPITEVILNEILDNVENSLVTFVLEHKKDTKYWVSMESMMLVQYQERLNYLLADKGGSIDRLESGQKLIVSNRIQDFLVFSKEKYESG